MALTYLHFRILEFPIFVNAIAIMVLHLSMRIG